MHFWDKKGGWRIFFIIKPQVPKKALKTNEIYKFAVWYIIIASNSTMVKILKTYNQFSKKAMEHT